jgi:tetratricopeptide (TPR) repeat protein
VADESRIEALKKRVQKDPGSIAFAQLAEEYRRAGRFQESIEVCRAGLARHPGYLSARVTLGRALLEIGDTESAERELGEVVRVAPDNLSAVRGLADVHRRRGELPEALEQFRAAFDLAGQDPTIEQIVRDLRREVVQAPAAPPPAAGSLVAEQGAALAQPAPAVTPVVTPAAAARAVPASPAAPPVPATPAPVAVLPPDHTRATRRTVAYLERWLEAIMADRRSRLYGTPA